MTADARILVTDGVHAGASVALSDDKPLRIGSGSDADLMVIDDGVEPLHATVQLRGAVLDLMAHRPGVTVFGRRLPPGLHVLVRRGTRFSAGAVNFQFSGPEAPSAIMVDDAEHAYLLRHAPLAYCVKRLSGVSPVAKATIFAAPLAFALLAWLASMPMSGTPRAQRADDRFRLVTTHLDSKSGALVYQGYVQSPADLAALTAKAWSQRRAAVMRVIVLSQLQEQVGDFLARYYRGAEVRPATPGAFSAILPGGEAFLSPESWDYARIARLARGEISGLRELTFPGHAQEGARVRVPLEALGMNLLSGRYAAWLSDAQGVRYLAGARLPAGRITRISACAVEVTRDDGSIYEFFTDATHGSKKCR
ncbi:FHA domain-containing protein [Paraburkholderia caffeinilytica]|uniref:YscD cytoplasmic domain-containing protein n=1 Tax=Paraburkholderia caffeinilytica TaxID=1761016 RepID=A0ABQ1M2H9_9BURK|nr:FHA domain-containing protein [Paraburkholderia caffeinilytica]GGC32301.1 hypothetical protein GCM10011400_18690 [Paraburkholderia caffeinilytica]CAB3796549.1 hypothetical protein LMG28690_04357 [Paraburkholderia caffeinilytica]